MVAKMLDAQREEISCAMYPIRAGLQVTLFTPVIPERSWRSRIQIYIYIYIGLNGALDQHRIEFVPEEFGRKMRTARLSGCLTDTRTSSAQCASHPDIAKTLDLLVDPADSSITRASDILLYYIHISKLVRFGSQ